MKGLIQTSISTSVFSINIRQVKSSSSPQNMLVLNLVLNFSALLSDGSVEVNKTDFFLVFQTSDKLYYLNP